MREVLHFSGIIRLWGVEKRQKLPDELDYWIIRSEKGFSFLCHSESVAALATTLFSRWVEVFGRVYLAKGGYCFFLEKINPFRGKNYDQMDINGKIATE